MKYPLLILSLLIVCISCKTKKNIVQTNKVTNKPTSSSIIYVENPQTGELMKINTIKNGQPKGKYFLHKIDGSNDPTMSRVSIEINVAKKSVSGTDGCNSYSGELASLENQIIEFGELAKTERECMIPAPFAETLYRKFEQVNSYSITPNGLLLRDAKGLILLEFLKKEE